MSKALKKKDSAELAAAKEYKNFVDDDGFEGQTSDDIQIPYLNLLQKLSKQCEGEENEVEGAKPGMLINSVTNDLYPDGVTFVPVYREREFVEWVHPDHGEGLVGRHPVDSDLVARAKAAAGSKFARLTNPDDETHILVDTVYVYGLVGEELEPIVISFASTKHTPLRRWNTQMKMCTVVGPDGEKVRPPLFAHEVVLKTRTQTNKGKTSFNFDIQPSKGNVKDSLLKPEDPKFQAAVKFRDLIKSGAAKPVEETSEAETSQDGDGAF